MTGLSNTESLIGVVLGGRYKLQSKESEELLGNVYRARDVQTQKLVQVKILHPHLASDNTRFGRFLREVQATSMVKHPNTIEMVDSGTHEGLHFLVMEYFPSHSLEDEIKSGTLPVERVAHIAAQIASAIGAAHQENVTHRALSPRNILLLDNARTGDFVKVRDFGLSKLEHFDSEESTNLTEMGSRVGNTAYMAPEYIDRDRFHPKGDLYALGCLMFQMLTGEPPYTGRAADVLTAHVVGDIPRPSSRSESVPEWMDDVIVSLLAKRPEDRPGAYKVVQTLEEGVGHPLEPPALADPAKGKVKREPPPPEKKPLPVAAIAGVLGVLVLIGGSALALVGVGLFFVFAYEPAAPSETVTEIVVEAPEPVVEPEPTEDPEPTDEPGPAPTPRPRTGPAPVAPSTPEPAPEPVEAASSSRTSVSIRSNRKALVFLNGNPKGFAPLTLTVPPGKHRVEAMLPSLPETRQKQEIRIRSGETGDLTFTF
ncbi:MAG: protein kinase [Myxococcota bacterium]